MEGDRIGALGRAVGAKDKEEALRIYQEIRPMCSEKNAKRMVDRLLWDRWGSKEETTR